jgi:hypothetical protein
LVTLSEVVVERKTPAVSRGGASRQISMDQCRKSAARRQIQSACRTSIQDCSLPKR